MIVHVFGEEKEILEIAYDSPRFLRREKFHKLHIIDHVFGEGKEIPEIGYDRPRFWRKGRNSRNCI
jgi:hypothetical protein